MSRRVREYQTVFPEGHFVWMMENGVEVSRLRQDAQLETIVVIQERDAKDLL